MHSVVCQMEVVSSCIEMKRYRPQEKCEQSEKAQFEVLPSLPGSQGFILGHTPRQGEAPAFHLQLPVTIIYQRGNGRRGCLAEKTGREINFAWGLKEGRRLYCHLFSESRLWLLPQTSEQNREVNQVCRQNFPISPSRLPIPSYPPHPGSFNALSPRLSLEHILSICYNPCIFANYQRCGAE